MTWQTAVDPILTTIRTNLAVPGLVIAVQRDGHAPEVLIAGTDANGQPLTADTLFPVASLTKLATTLAVLRLAAAGALQLDDLLAKHLPAAGAAQPGVTLRSLLCHTSGLPLDVEPWLAPYAAGLDWPTLAQACLATPLARPPQTQVVYSNLGPGLLAIVVERLTRQPFADALTRLVLSPLQIEGYLGVEPPRTPARDRRPAGHTCRHTAGAVQLCVLSFPCPAVGWVGHNCGGRPCPRADVCGRAGWFPAPQFARGHNARPDRRDRRRHVRAAPVAAQPLGTRRRAAR